MYHNIPLELRAFPHWVTWRHEVVNGRRTKVPYNAAGQYRANVNNPATWGSFDEACRTALSATMDGIGFVLTDGDPYTGIDIDDKLENPASENEKVVHNHILESFQSYTERSPSGRGYHIIIRGKIKGGRDKHHVGVYSTQRYLTFSGDVVRNAPIAEYQQQLEQLVSHMPDNSAEYELLDMEEVMTDREVHEMALAAFNGDKYDRLCRGAITFRDSNTSMGPGGDPAGEYQSPSEADLALISILGYYTRNDEQVRRIFRHSALGRRGKHDGSNRWIDRCLRIFRSKQAPPTDMEAARRNAEAILATSQAQAEEVQADSTTAHTVDGIPFDASTGEVLGHPVAPAPVARAPVTDYTLPPGLVGELANYIYSTATRPVPEAALVGAIALVAGVAGRAYNISGTGLNQYLLFVAKTGTGKEAIEKGINKLIASARTVVPMADEFIGPSAFASGQGLIRVLDKRPCFVSVMGEFGLTLQALSDPRAPAASVLLRRVLLDLYSKSGWQDVLRETAYSDTDKNTKMIHAPAVTIAGETTPETFYDGIDASDIADGLIPRFHIVEYRGGRPERNRHAGHAPDTGLLQRFTDLLTVAITSKQNMTCSAVQMNPDAEALMDAFDRTCDAHMNGKVSPAEAQVWNRAHLKALKLAGVLAVGCNPHAPVVDITLARWAIEFVERGCAAVLARFDRGDVGQGQQKQMADVRRMVEEYFKYDSKSLASYKVKPEIQKASLIPYSYFTVRASRLASFNKDRNGYVRALKVVLDDMCAAEQLGQLTPVEAQEKFQKREALFYIGSNY